MRSLSSRARTFATIALVAAFGVAGAGCAGDDDTAAFEEEVVTARDTADSSFANIKRPESTEDLILRLRTSRDRLQRVSGSLAEADAPDGLADEQSRLVAALREMSREMEAAANSIELVQSGDGAGAPVETLVFDTWDSVQAILTELRSEGIDVPPLRPGGGP